MSDSNKQEIRSALGEHYADVLQNYWEQHQRLVLALADDAVSLEEFERMSADVQAAVNGLKEIKREMKRQTDVINRQP